MNIAQCAGERNAVIWAALPLFHNNNTYNNIVCRVPTISHSSCSLSKFRVHSSVYLNYTNIYLNVGCGV